VIEIFLIDINMEQKKDGVIDLVYCQTENQIANLFTKPLLASKFEDLRQNMKFAVPKSKRSVRYLFLKLHIDLFQFLNTSLIRIIVPNCFLDVRIKYFSF